MSLLHQILSTLDPEDESYHRLRAQALDEGYTAEYSDEFLGMEPELPARDCELVGTSLTCSGSSGPALTSWAPTQSRA